MRDFYIVVGEPKNMKNNSIKVEKYVEEIPLTKAVDIASQVLRKPEGMDDGAWKQNLSQDFVSGKKFFTIRELKLSQKLE